MVENTYEDAVVSLASSITSSQGQLSDERSIAVNILDQGDTSNIGENKSIQLTFNPKSREILENYLNELRQAKNAEIGKEIHQSIENARRLTELRDRLEHEVDVALNETKELEKIAERLQDSGLGKIAGKEEKEVNELGRKLGVLDKKGKEVEDYEQRLLNLTKRLGIGHGELQNELEERIQTVEEILSKGSGSGNNGGGNSVDLDQVAENILNHEVELEKLENKALEDYKEDIQKVSEAVEHKKQEVQSLGELRDLLQEWNQTSDLRKRDNLMDEISDKLVEIKRDRDNLLGANTLEEFIEDREEAKNLLKGIGELQEKIRAVENQGGKDKLVQKIADISDLEANQVENITADIKQKYEEVEEDIEKITKLENENLELDEEALAKTKQLFEAGEEAVHHLDKEASIKTASRTNRGDIYSSYDREKLFKQIFQDLKYLGKEIEKNIEIEEGTTVVDSYDDPFNESWEEYKSGDSTSTNGGDSNSSNIDQVAQQIYRDRQKLEKFEQKAQADFEKDIRNLSELIEHKKREINGLSEVHTNLQDGNIKQVKQELDEIKNDRENILEGDSVQDVFEDIEELKNISIGVKRFFQEIERINQTGNIQELEKALASYDDISEDKSEKLVDLRNQKQRYETLQSEISKIEELEKENLGLDQKEYNQVKKLFKEESDLANQINDPSYQQIFNRIHSELEQLGHEIEHDIEIEGGNTGSDTESQNTSVGGNESSTDTSGKKGPGSGDPWIVSLSDIESWPGFLTNSLKLVNRKYETIVDFSGDSPKWAGNNYKLIINGDLIQHGRHGGAQETKELIEKLRAIVNSAENQTKDGVHPVQFTVGNHDPNLVFGGANMYPEGGEINTAKGANFVQTYRTWTDKGIVNMAISGYNYTYVHAGQAHEWTDQEISEANGLLRDMDRSFSGSIPFPDHDELKKISISQTEAHKLRKETLLKSVEQLDTQTKIRLFNFDKKDLYTESDDTPGFMNGSYKGDLEDVLSKQDILDNLENANQLGLNRIKFGNLKDDQNKYAKLLGVGESGSGDNIHAGMNWARTSYVQYGSPQIVGHSGQDQPKRKGNLIIENTSAGSGAYSVVIETKNNVWALVGDDSGNVNNVNL